MTFEKDEAVVITGGLLEGKSATVVRRSDVSFGREAMYLVDVGGTLGQRVIRETFLKVVARRSA